MENPVTRVYLLGEVQVELGDRLLREADLPARQGRLALVHLVHERRRAVPQAELAEVLWPGQTPAAWTLGLSAIVSKLRRCLGGVGLDRDRVLPAALGCYQMRLPEGSWVDVEAARTALHLAEAAVMNRRPEDAYGPALIATTIFRRPLLAGEDGAWVEERRREMNSNFARALECFIPALTSNGEHALALRHAEDLVRIEPFRESGYRRLMSLHAAMGDRAEALRVYGRCRELLDQELGVGPSVETEALRSTLAG